MGYVRWEIWLNGQTIGHVTIDEMTLGQTPGSRMSVCMPVPAFEPAAYLQVSAQRRCSWVSSDFNDAERAQQWEEALLAEGACRTYWGDGHRCRQARGHEGDHRCEHGTCTPFSCYIAWGPDVRKSDDDV